MLNRHGPDSLRDHVSGIDTVKRPHGTDFHPEPRSQQSCLDHTAMDAVWSREVRKFQTPDTLPNLRNMSHAFGRVNQLSSSNVRRRRPNGSSAAQVDRSTEQQQANKQLFSQRHHRVLPWTPVDQWSTFVVAIRSDGSRTNGLKPYESPAPAVDPPEPQL